MMLRSIDQLFQTDPKVLLVNINDLLPLLRILRKDGLSFWRVKDRAIWHVQVGLIIKEIYADRTGTVPRGTTYLIDRAKFPEMPPPYPRQRREEREA